MSFFGKRLSAELRVVHSCDPALESVDVSTMDRYLLTRDISVIPSDALAGASIFTVRPLLTKYENLATLAVSEPQAQRALFRYHVCAATGPAASELQFETRDGLRQLTEQSADECSIEFISELVAVIIFSASRRGDQSPFSPPDSWRQNRRLSARARALAALAQPSDQSATTTEGASAETGTNQ